MGYIQPTTTTGVSGSKLNDFLQALVVGLSNLDDTLVFPRWQAEPPTLPDVPWAAVGWSGKKGNDYAFAGKYVSNYNPQNLVVDYELQNHEEIECLASFYDLGTDGAADDNATLFRDNFQIPQNLEALQLAGWGFVECSEPVNVPSLVKQRWYNRVDVKFILRQQVTRVYPVPDIETLDVTTVTD